MGQQHPALRGIRAPPPYGGNLGPVRLPSSALVPGTLPSGALPPNAPPSGVLPPGALSHLRGAVGGMRPPLGNVGVEQRPLLLQEQPLLLEELVEQEKREQRKQGGGSGDGPPAATASLLSDVDFERLKADVLSGPPDDTIGGPPAQAPLLPPVPQQHSVCALPNFTLAVLVSYSRGHFGYIPVKKKQPIRPIFHACHF